MELNKFINLSMLTSSVILSIGLDIRDLNFSLANSTDCGMEIIMNPKGT